MGVFCMVQKTQKGALDQPRRVEGEGNGREVQKGGDICIPMADSCQCMVKPPQYCKVISLQLK